MKRTAFFILLLVFGIFAFNKINNSESSGAPPYVIEDLQPPSDPLAWIQDWKRPDGPPRVGLQVGHWKNDELPQELERLKGNTGASGGGKSEWEVNFAIAEEAAKLLRVKGIEVDILPSTVPVDYWADVFVAIHADGNLDRSKRGFKVAKPRRDYTNKGEELLKLVESNYKEATNFEIDPNVSRNMTGYYAFAWWRYDHAVHPMTTSIILETGFLSNALDRRIIVARPEISAQGLANGVVEFLQGESLLPTASPATTESSTPTSRKS